MTTLPIELSELGGARELCNWFGYWPDFHDAEVVSISLNRSGVSRVSIYTWEMTDKTDKDGYYVQAKHVLVDFSLESIVDLNLNGFSHQNVIAGLTIENTKNGYRFTLDPCYGVSGVIEAAKASIRLRPGLLATSQVDT